MQAARSRSRSRPRQVPSRIGIFVTSDLCSFWHDVAASDTIDTIKVVIFLEEGIPPDQQRIWFDGRYLIHGGKTVEALGLQDNDELDVFGPCLRTACGRYCETFEEAVEMLAAVLPDEQYPCL